MCKKMSSNFLKLLKRSGLSIEELHYFYITVIRPISEYACTVWNHNITATLSDQLGYNWLVYQEQCKLTLSLHCA